jgi:[acyl-carrier-protein] S-malonyltransferase
MGKDLCEACPKAAGIFDQAEQITSLPLKKLCFEGPEEELARTDICQPAIFTMSAAVLASLQGRLGAEKFAALAPAYLAGLSLGEYTALYAAGVLTFEAGLKLVARRGALMQQAATAVPSGMVALVGMDEAKTNELCRAAAGGEVLSCANFNCPGQIVISGQIEACKRAEAMAKDFGASVATALKVAGAFHSAIMKPAADGLAAALEQVEFLPPRAAVMSNVTAQPHGDSAAIKKLLVEQLTSPVRWQQCCEYMKAHGVTEGLEIGPNKVLMGLMRRIDRAVKVTPLNGKEALEKMGQ